MLSLTLASFGAGAPRPDRRGEPHDTVLVVTYSLKFSASHLIRRLGAPRRNPNAIVFFDRFTSEAASRGDRVPSQVTHRCKAPSRALPQPSLS